MAIDDISPDDLPARLRSLPTDTCTAVLFWSPASPINPKSFELFSTVCRRLGDVLVGLVIDVDAHPQARKSHGFGDTPEVRFFQGETPVDRLPGPFTLSSLVEALGQAFPGLATHGRRALRRRPGKRPGTDSSAAARHRGAHDGPVLPTPRQMQDHLDRFIRGQTRAKRDVASAIYNHYLAQADRDENGGEPRPHHILLLGPTGCGKTFIVRTIAAMLGVPFAIVSAAGLVEAGFRGRNPDSIVKALLDRSGGDPRLAEKGIIFIDEIDKVRRQDTGGARDVSGEGVQNALLTLIGGRIADNVDGVPHPAVDTSKILFVCTGAFVDLPDIVRRRVGSGRSRIGFRCRTGERVADIPDPSVYEALCQAQTVDLVDFGLIPEFIGRFTTVSALHELGLDDLRRIIDDGTEESALEHYRRLAALHGMELSFDDGALDAIASEAVALGTGARGLARLIGRVMDGVDRTWPELADDGVTRVVVDREVVLAGREPRFEKGRPLIERRDVELRHSCLHKVPPSPRHRPRIARLIQKPDDLSKLTPEGIARSLDAIKRRWLGWSDVSGSERLWWMAIEAKTKPEDAHRIAEALRERGATIAEAFAAHVKSGCDDLDVVFCYLDFLRAKDRADKRGRTPDIDPTDDLFDGVPF